MRVRLADDFFKKEREQTYADWKLSVWRELFQNSIDQNASEIRISLAPSDDGAVCLTFADNGPGMSREVLESVYFAIGATTKTGSNQIGGMGRARVLTCFAMQSYQIRSHDYLAIGTGGEYDVHDAPFAAGCKLVIAVDDATTEEMHGRLLRFLDESRIAARVYLNDKLLTARAALLGRHSRDLSVGGVSFASVYVNKSAASHRVIVRVRGVSMFTMRTSAKAQVVIELNPGLSRNVLTSNRDGLRDGYRYVLDDFLRELAVDTVSSLRERFTRHTTVAHGGGMRTIRRKPKAVLMQGPVSGTVSITNNANNDSPITSGHVGTMVREGDDTETSLTLDSWLAQTFGDIYIDDETNNQKVRRVIANYIPENWQTMTVDGRSFRKGGNILKVLLMWQTAIDYAIEVALEPLGIDDIRCSVGFLFADDRRAEHCSKDGGHVFSLCPVDDNGKLAFAVTNRTSIKRLMALAKHEVTHVRVSWHSESFASLREEIDERFHEAECLRRIKAALLAVPDLEDEHSSYPRWAA